MLLSPDGGQCEDRLLQMGSNEMAVVCLPLIL